VEPTTLLGRFALLRLLGPTLFSEVVLLEEIKRDGSIFFTRWVEVLIDFQPCQGQQG